MSLDFHYPSSPTDSSYSDITTHPCAFPYISGDQLDNKPRQRIKIAHPYARLFAKTGEVKRRKIWNHALEKSLFSPYELYVHNVIIILFSQPVDRRLELLTAAPSICQAWKRILIGSILSY